MLSFNLRRFLSGKPHSRQPSKALVKPSLLQLEDRLVPASWARGAGGALADAGRAVATDLAGNVYVAGTIQDQAAVGGVTLTSAGGNDAFVAKYAKDGSLLWAHNLGGAFDDEATALTVEPGIYFHGKFLGGGVYVAGVFAGTVDFGGTTLTATGARDVYVEKLDSGGNAVWVHQFANDHNFGSFWCGPHGLAVDSKHDVVVNGFFAGRMDMDYQAHPNQHVLKSVGEHPDAFVAKLSGAGNFVWDAKAIDWDAQTQDWDGVNAYGIAVDKSDNVYTIGAFQSNAWFFDSQGGISHLADVPLQNTVYVWKMNSAGGTSWVKKTADCPNAAALSGLGIAVDKTGGIYTTGMFVGQKVDFDPQGPQFLNKDLRNASNPTTYLQKLNSAGKFQWVRQAGGTASYDQQSSVALDSAGNPYLAGWVTDAASHQHSFVAKLNPAGTFLAAVVSQSLAAHQDHALGMAVDHEGYVDLTGSYTAKMQINGLTLPPSAGAADVFVVHMKLGPTSAKLIDRVVRQEVRIDPFPIIDDRHWGPLERFHGLSDQEIRALSELAKTSSYGLVDTPLVRAAFRGSLAKETTVLAAPGTEG